MWKPDLPYNELPFPPIDELETRSILRAAANARAALAGLDQVVKQIPNPEILFRSSNGHTAKSPTSKTPATSRAPR